MAAPTAGRMAALATLRAVRGGALADRALDTAADGLDGRERAWTQELVYGALRLRGRLDHHLAALSRRPLDRLDPDILDILRLGAYELTEMGGVPPYAAVSQAVELAKRAGGRGADGFVNGVLQSLRRARGASTFPSWPRETVAYLSTWGSHPRWLVERWVDRYGAGAAEALVRADNERPELYLRALGGGTEGARALLAGAGVESEPVPGVPLALRVLEGSPAAALDAAPVIVQDPAAGLVATFVGPVHGTALDLTAAPGGKALAVACAEPAGRARFVAAADISASRMARLTANVRRVSRAEPEGLGGVPAAAVVADARAAPFRQAGAVLLDAPCTGTGTLRRHPDGRWRVRPEDLVALVRLQAELLAGAAALVAPGGLLVYSTCSLESEENEVQVSAFLEQNGDFALEPGAGVDAAFLRSDGTLYVLPHEHGFDGAFAARLRRRA